MCGITGFISKQKESDKEKVIKKMADRIKHRGPDGEGYYVDAYIALGHRRLSIIDIKGGSQPMYSTDKKLVVIFNGEIYNYKELKEELKDYKFKSKSDTEVLLAGYKKWGKNLPKHLRGMFAFAIYDVDTKEVFIARDHFGIKPLYYYQNNGTFMFASEIKSFLEHPDFDKVLNEDIIPGYMTFSFTPTNETFFKGVKRLDAGCSLTYKDEHIEIERYYKLDFEIHKEDYNDTVTKIEDAMKDSVEHHMIADVEVGSFLSGGVDSNYLVTLAHPDKTYTVGYQEERYSEIDNAKDLADKLGIKNVAHKITKDEYFKAIDKVLYHMDEPTSDPAIVSLYFVSQLAAKDVKVVLSGEGSDEFFGGYNTYLDGNNKASRMYNKIPYFLRHGLACALKHTGPFRGRNFLVRRGLKLEDYYVGINRVYDDSEIKKYFKLPIKLTNKEITSSVYADYKGESDLVKMQAIDINYWLVKDILHKGDRMTMANSLESRVPFTDKCVFSVASTLPLDYKVTPQATKVALRDAAKKVIPNDAYSRKKLGFPVPVRDWMRDDDVYNDIKKEFEKPIANKYFNTKKLIKLLDDHKNKKHDNYRKVWNIYIFLKWYDRFFVQES